jgi:uncharacterized protein with FMN-binding domain
MSRYTEKKVLCLVGLFALVMFCFSVAGCQDESGVQLEENVAGSPDKRSPVDEPADESVEPIAEPVVDPNVSTAPPEEAEPFETEISTETPNPFEAVSIPDPFETPDPFVPTPESDVEEVSITLSESSGPSLDEQVAAYTIPPSWMDEVEVEYDIYQHPWSEGRIEIRRLLGLDTLDTHRQAMKLTWLYLQQDDIGDGHEYPMYTFLGGEPLWSVHAHQWYIAKPRDELPVHAYVSLAKIYLQYKEYERAEQTLLDAWNGLSESPYSGMQKADLQDYSGDVFLAWGKIDDAKRCWGESVRLYPLAAPPSGGHLLPRKAAKVQAKLDMLTAQSIGDVELRDGSYNTRALGYAGDINLTVRITDGRIADIQVRHEEKIDQGACESVPAQIIERQSLDVDGVSGATVTKDAIVSGVFDALKRAGLE